MLDGLRDRGSEHAAVLLVDGVVVRPHHLLPPNTVTAREDSDKEHRPAVHTGA